MVRVRKQLAMLANVLAVLLGFGSLIFYIAAFLYPEVHRRSDWIWSGLGLIYATDLWFSAEQTTSALLLGQVVSVVLLVGLGWQTLTVRREKTPVYQQTPVVLTPEVVGGWAKNRLNQLRIAPVDTVRPATLSDRPVTGAATERLRQGLQSPDPRRRPQYDYEFVEDGILETTPTAPEISAEDLEAVVSDIETIDPPSAIAQVITVQTNQADPRTEADIPQTKEEVPKSSEIETAEEAAEPEALEPQASPPEPIESETSKSIAIESIEARSTETAPTARFVEDSLHEDLALDKLEPDESASDGLEPDGLEPDGSKSDRLESDGLELDRTETIKAEATIQPKPTEPSIEFPKQPSREKPSLLSMPIIFAGWLKDVVQSLTKPKPSKPVIDIPRRDAPSIDTNATQTSANDSNWDDDSDWDDSDWID